MGRNRFVQPDIVRLPLADVHRNALRDLQDSDKQKALRPDARATRADIELAKAKLADAEADGAWIDIKKELNAGETRRVFGRLVKDMRAGEAVMLEPEQVGLTKISEYVVGWSFTDAAGRPVDVSEGAINNLDQETYKEIADAIDAHETKMQAEKDARKNYQTGTLTSEAISVSAGT